MQLQRKCLRGKGLGKILACGGRGQRVSNIQQFCFSKVYAFQKNNVAHVGNALSKPCPPAGMLGVFVDFAKPSGHFCLTDTQAQTQTFGLGPSPKGFVKGLRIRCKCFLRKQLRDFSPSWFINE